MANGKEESIVIFKNNKGAIYRYICEIYILAQCKFASFLISKTVSSSRDVKMREEYSPYPSQRVANDELNNACGLPSTVRACPK